MTEGGHGIVAAGHPLTAQAGARVLREGGNAVDAAVGAMLTSFAAEPLLTGLGAGGYMLVAGGEQQPALLDFFVAARGRRARLRMATRIRALRTWPSCRRSTCRSATPRRCFTSDRRRAGPMVRPLASARLRGVGGRSRWRRLRRRRRGSRETVWR